MTASIQVLHVDDDQDFAELVATFLEREDERIEVHTATGGDEALTLLEQVEFDCLVSDFDMPGRNGIELLESVREDYAELPYILFTGKGSEEIAGEAISAGVTDYLQKAGSTEQYTILANRIMNAVEQFRSRREIERSEARLRKVVDSLPHLLYVVDENGKYLLANQALADFHNTTVDEIEGSRVEEMLPDSIVERFYDDLSTVFEADELVRYPDIEITDASGVKLMLQPRLVPFDYGESDTRTALGFSMDITERRKQEARVDETNQWYSQLLDHVSDYVMVVDDAGEIDYISPSIEHVMGYTPKEIEGQSAFEFVHEDDREKAAAAFMDTFEEPGRELTVEFRAWHSDGSVRWLEVKGTNLLDDPIIQGIIVNARDVTERKLREHQLRRQERRYQAVFNDPNILVGLLDTDGAVIDINETAMEYIDVSKDELVGEPFWETPWFERPEGITEQVKDWISRAVEGEYVEFEADLVRQSGEEYSIEGVFRPVFNEEGDVVSLLISDQDITEQKHYQRDLERTQELLEMTQRIADVGGWEIDGDTLDVSRTETMLDLLEVDEEYASTLDVALDDVHPDDRDRLDDLITKALEHGDGFDTEVRIQLPDDEIRWLHIRGEPRIENGDIVAVRGAVQDITERVQRLDELEEAKARFQTFVEHSNDIITVLDEHGVVKYESPAIEEVLGYSQEELIGENIFELIHPEDRQYVVDRFTSVVNHPGTVTETLEFRLKDATGDWVWLEAIGSNQLDSVIDGYVVNSRDITDRKQRIQALERERNRFESVFEAVPEPVVHVKYEGDDPIVQNVNEAFKAVFGYGVDEIRGMSLDEVIVPDGHQSDAAEINRLVREEDFIEAEIIRETVDGERPFLFTAKMMDFYTEGEERLEGVATYVDLTEQKQREAELSRQNERLDEFASVVSHDLRNPLNVATGRLDLAKTECDSAHLDEVENAHERMKSLIDDLLTLARQGASVSEHETVPLGTVAERCWQTVKTSDATLKVTTDRTISGDSSRLRQALENLFRNAIEHGGEDVTVTVGELEDGFFVEDDGPGIPEGEREAVFEAGYTTSETGTGFGLGIVSKIVEAHGWDISVTEGATGGARFEITGIEFVED